MNRWPFRLVMVALALFALVGNPGAQTLEQINRHLIALEGGHGGFDVNRDQRIDSADAYYTIRGEGVFLLNAGGVDYTDPSGRLWTSDSVYANTGTTFSTSTPIEGTVLGGMFQTERFDPPAGPELQYNLPLPNGDYIVRLYFAEIAPNINVGGRIFNVVLEGNAVETGLDITAQAGGKFRPLVKEYTTRVDDGALTVLLKRVVENPKISGIEVLRVRMPRPIGEAVARINVGGGQYTDPFGRVWQADQGFNGGLISTTSSAVLGSQLPGIYNTQRYITAGNLSYNLPIASGRYRVVLHFAEIFFTSPGQRVFDVAVEGQTTIANLDMAARTVPFGSFTHVVETTVADGALNINLLRKVENPQLAGIEVYLASPNRVEADRTQLLWAETQIGTTGATYQVALTNLGDSTAHLNRLIFNPDTGSAAGFKAFVGSRFLSGGPTEITHIVDIFVPPHQTVLLPVFFSPKEQGNFQARMTLTGSVPPITIGLVGSTPGGGHGGHPYLHVVIEGPPFVIDYNGDGAETVPLDGSKSHTHQLGGQLTRFEWRDGAGNLFSTDQAPSPNFNLGDVRVCLTIFDNNTPPESLTDCFETKVVPPNNVPYALLYYYEKPAGDYSFDLANPPGPADYVQYSATLRIQEGASRINFSPYDRDVMVRAKARINIPEAGRYVFAITGGEDRLLLINGEAYSGGAINLPAGLAQIDARFEVDSIANLPLEVRYAREGEEPAFITFDRITHDQTTEPPVITAASNQGSSGGGQPVEITGFFFFPSNQVSVVWGDITLSGSQLTVTPTSIRFSAPPGNGQVQAYVVNPAGQSNRIFYTYTDSAAIPINFVVQQGVVTGFANPTRAAWGPDGRLYVADLNGFITAIEFNDNYGVVSSVKYDGVSKTTSKNILGIAFNPHDVANPPKIYVAHNALYYNGGFCFTGFSPYSGVISTITGPNFNTPVPIITGLPVSNHDHGINGMAFDHKGDLFIAVGGNTNAGIPDCNIGGLQESPLSGAVLKAEISKPNFNGNILYRLTSSGAQNNDQVSGGVVDVIPGVDVRVFAHGLRNTFDIEFTQEGRLYAVDNGADPGFGNASYGPTQQGPAPDANDELNLLIDGMYYGHPNHNRARYDARQYVYYPPSAPSDPNVERQPLLQFNYSTNGLTQYRAQTFRGAMRNHLVAQIWNSDTVRIRLNADGTAVTQSAVQPWKLNALDILHLPGGVLMGVDYSGNKLNIARPSDAGAVGLTVYDIFPYRAHTRGGQPFVIGGVNFGTNPAAVSVQIGGVPATITSVSNTRIKGILPARPSAPESLLPVSVTVAGNTAFIPQAFRYVGDTVADNGTRAFVEIDPAGSTIASSTYNANSFKIRNNSTAGQKITKVTIDLSTAVFPDMVFDPFGQAGDTVPKQFTLDMNNTGGSVNHTMTKPRDGGFDAIELTFGDFGPGKGINFSIDVDPTTSKGTPPPGPGESASVSGLELAGATVTVQFNDNSQWVGELFPKPSSTTGSRNTFKPVAPAQPTLQVLNGIPPFNTNAAAQTIRVSAPVGSVVVLSQIESALYVNNNPFDLDPWEHNTALNVTESSQTVGSSGFVDFNVTLRKSNNNAGYNVFVATVRDSAGDTGNIARALIKLD